MIIINYFSEAKSRLDMRDVLEAYGISVNRSGMCLCPFHAEKTPSCKVYPDGIHCFGCGEHHDIISFVKTYFGLSGQMDALKKINCDFSLGFDFGNAPNKQEISRFARERSEREAYRKWEEKAWRVLVQRVKLLQFFQAEYAPKTPEDVLDNRYILACHNLDYATYILEEFQETKFEERRKFKEAYQSAREFLDIWLEQEEEQEEEQRTLLPSFKKQEINHENLLRRKK